MINQWNQSETLLSKYFKPLKLPNPSSRSVQLSWIGNPVCIDEMERVRGLAVTCHRLLRIITCHFQTRCTSWSFASLGSNLAFILRVLLVLHILQLCSRIRWRNNHYTNNSQQKWRFRVRGNAQVVKYWVTCAKNCDMTAVLVIFCKPLTSLYNYRNFIACSQLDLILSDPMSRTCIV